MNKRTTIGVAVSAIVLTLLIAFGSSYLQTTDRESLNVAATVLVAIGTLALAGATFLLAQTAAKEIQETRIEHRETERASFRPLVVPAKDIDVSDGKFWTRPGYTLPLQNAGPGVAMNVRGVIFPVVGEWNDTYKQYSMHSRVPIPPSTRTGWQSDAQFIEGGTLLQVQDQVGGIELGAPHIVPTSQLDTRDRYVARLTLTYSDLFGAKHASIFDLTTLNVWVSVKVRDDIDKDLGDLNVAKGGRLRRRHPLQTQTGFSESHPSSLVATTETTSPPLRADKVSRNRQGRAQGRWQAARVGFVILSVAKNHCGGDNALYPNRL